MPVRVNDPKKVPYNQVVGLGVVIRFNPNSTTQQHMGFLYQSEDATARICHLVTHLNLVDEIPDNTYCWIQVGIAPENIAVVAAIVKRVVERAPRIRYGLRYEGEYFGPSGDYIRRGLGNGLTCSTFILAVFRSAGFELLKIDEWPSGRAGDLEFQLIQTRWLRDHHPGFLETDEQAHIGDPRYRPDEVAAGASSKRIPLGLAEADKLAREISTALNRRQNATGGR